MIKHSVSISLLLTLSSKDSQSKHLQATGTYVENNLLFSLYKASSFSPVILSQDTGY